VWHDLNRNGLQDSGEPGLDGVTVNLMDDANTIIATTTTSVGPGGQHGYYQFTGVCADTYFVDVVTPAGFSPASPCSTSQTVGNDSNCSPAQVDLTTDNSSNQTIDFGFVTPCTGAIGDFVWHDLNRNGLQDTGEPGLDGVTVNLRDDANTIIATTTTSVGPGGQPGYYQFTGLCADTYFVEAVTPAGFSPTSPCSTSQTVGNDSNCSPAQVDLTTDNSSNQTIDFGFIMPPECSLVVDKKCFVEPPAPSEWASCKGKIQQFTLIWNGTGSINISGITNDAPGGVVDPGQTVTFKGPWTVNDLYLNITGAVTGRSTFHVSCSDADMDGRTSTNLSQQQVSPLGQDCGKWEGDGKALSGTWVKTWVLDGLIDAEGKVLDCTPAPVAGTDACSFEAPETPDCATLGKPLSLTFLYTGAGCIDGNDQAADKWACSGEPGSDPVSIAIVKDPARITVSPSSGIRIGDLVTVSRKVATTDMGSEIQLKVGSQSLKIHTSCSQPLAVGDVFGSLELVKFNGQSAGADVTYTYTITNAGDTSVELTSVVDDKMGNLLQYFQKPAEPPIILVQGESRTANVPALIGETTPNTVTVTGEPVGYNTVCTATDSVTVTVEPPPPPPFVCSNAKPIDQMTVIWNGSQTIWVKAYNGAISTQPFKTFGPIAQGGEVTFSRVGTGVYPNDIYFEIFSNAAMTTKLGKSTFHLSCSDADMNGPEDCGKAAGDGKAKAGYINQWIFTGMAGKGLVLDCTP
jgi:hypothetical protein